MNARLLLLLLLLPCAALAQTPGIRINQLPVAAPLNGTESIPAWQGATVQTTPAAIAAYIAPVTSVGLTVPSWLSVTGCPITSPGGTCSIAAAPGQPANYVLAAPSGSSGALSPRALANTDLPPVLTPSFVSSALGFSSPGFAVDGAGNLNAQSVSVQGVAVPSYPRTAAEISASVVPTNYGYPPGNVLRYGADPTGVVDSTAAITSAITVAACGNVVIPAGTYLTSSSLPITCATITEYGATINYTGSGCAYSTPGTGATTNPAILGGTIEITSSGCALSLASSYHGSYRDIRITGASGTTNVAILIGVNTSGTVNPAGNLNTAFNLLSNILVDVAVGTGVRMTGNATGPVVVTLNTFLNFNMGGASGGGAAVYGIEFNSWADNNSFDGKTRIGLQSPTSAAGVGIVWNSGTPASNVGVYSNNVEDLAVDCFGTPTGDVRIGAKFNQTKQNRLTNFYQNPTCAGGAYTVTANTQSTIIHLVNDTIGYQDIYITGNGIELPQTIVASLPTCTASLKGVIYSVSDATSPTYNATLTGSGTVSIPVYCNGANWTAH